MTKQELIEKLKRIKKEQWDNQEIAHIEADDAVMDYINDVEIEAAYNDIDKWYA